MNQVTKGRDFRLDTIKTIMIMGIVVEHTLIIYGYPRKHELFWGAFIGWIMPMFTLISGFLYKPRPIKELVSKYLYPMFLFSAINFFVGFLFYYRYNNGFVIGYAMWYLWALFWFAIITTFLLKILDIRIAIIVSFFSVIVYLHFLPLSSLLSMWAMRLQVNRIVGFYPFYLLGVYLRKKDFLKPPDRITLWRVVLFGTMIVNLILCYLKRGFAYMSAFYLTPHSGIVSVIKYLISYVVISVICISIIKSISNKENFLAQYGERTLNVYLLHMLVVFSVGYGLFSRLGYSYLYVVVNCLVACGLCLPFFSNKVAKIMSVVMSNKRWVLVMVFYGVAVVLVNYNLIKELESV